MKYSVSRQSMTLFVAAATLIVATPSMASDPHYTSPSENIKKFFSGTWEGSFQVGYALPQSSAELDGAMDWSVGVYHDFGSRMATEIQYLSSADFNSQSDIGSSASFKTNALVASLRGYGKPTPGEINYFGRMGIAYYSVDFDNGTSVDTNYESGTSFVLGFGAEKRKDEKTTFTLEVTYYHDMVQSGYVNTINVGVRQALATW